MTTNEMLQTVLDNIRGALMIAYPQGLPADEPAQYILDDDEDLSKSAVRMTDIVDS